uniref:Venom toxin n=1 Tax=Hemiscorpius lepturus TaxID=520031 RepID=A0A1L4BJA5_HEMLE|nr:venom toxin [Hemiscorpius lepturus]
MVNSLPQIDEFLNLGANALEADFAFDDEGYAKWTYHGYPCDCFRSCKRYERVDDYLRYVRELTSRGSPKFRSDFVLLQIDLKISGLSKEAKHNAGVDVAVKLIRHLWSGKDPKSQLWILLSFPYTTDIDFVEGFLPTLRANGYHNMQSRIGWDISGNEDLIDIKKTYQRLGISNSVWQGDGITNCLPRSIKRLVDAIYRRDFDAEWEFLKKVYYWTLDKSSSMRQALRVGVDAIITNHPDRFVSVLASDEFSKSHRLATIRDNPWQKIQQPQRYLSQYTANVDYVFYECNPEQETEQEDTDE